MAQFPRKEDNAELWRSRLPKSMKRTTNADDDSTEDGEQQRRSRAAVDHQNEKEIIRNVSQKSYRRHVNDRNQSVID